MDETQEQAKETLKKAIKILQQKIHTRVFNATLILDLGIFGIIEVHIGDDTQNILMLEQIMHQKLQECLGAKKQTGLIITCDNCRGEGEIPDRINGIKTVCGICDGGGEVVRIPV